MEEKPKTIDEVLLRLQESPIVLVKDRQGQVGQQKTRYADLVQANEKILTRLYELDTLWAASPTLMKMAGPNGQETLQFVLEWELQHIPSGTKRTGIYPLPNGATPMQNGSAITYARRYALVAVTNAVADDDDDDGAGYRGRAGMAQRANVRQERATAQRSTGPEPRPERSRPAQQPDLPDPQQAASEPARGRDGLITQPMVGKLQAELGKLGDDFRDQARRKAFVCDLIGRELASTKDLTFAEGRAAIDALVNAGGQGPRAVVEHYRQAASGGAPVDEKPAARPRGRQKPAETRTVAQQTHDAIHGQPWKPGDEEPPWETVAPADDGWPAPTVPGGAS